MARQSLHAASKPSDGRVVVVTGASAGLGRAIVDAFATKGYDLGLLARAKDRLEETKRAVEARGRRAIAIPTDVADAQQIEAAASIVEDELGPIDIWVNNAMVSVFSPVSQMLPEEFERVTQVTYLGYVYGTLTALKRMLPRDRGVIVQVGSALAYRSIPLQAAYCAAKHAVLGFTESLRCELLHDGSRIRVTMVQMPALNTPQFGWVKSRLPNKAQPVPPIFQPEVGAEAVLWAAQHAGRELRVGFSTVKAIWGDKLFPGLLDRYMARVGYSAQLTDKPADRERPHNLWKPVPGNPGSHGEFDSRARGHSFQLWLVTSGRPVAAALVLATLFTLIVLLG